MRDDLDKLHRLMEAAAAALDFEAAARLRDQLSLLRGNPDAEMGSEIDTTRLRRQTPGQMGLGTSEQSVSPAPGWRPPQRPDPMTARQRPAKRQKR